MTINKYSKKEIEMFTKLGFQLELQLTSITPQQLYKLAAVKCFITNINDAATISLRNCIIAIDSGKERLTAEFDSLIIPGTETV